MLQCTVGIALPALVFCMAAAVRDEVGSSVAEETGGRGAYTRRTGVVASGVLVWSMCGSKNVSSCCAVSVFVQGFHWQAVGACGSTVYSPNTCAEYECQESTVFLLIVFVFR